MAGWRHFREIAAWQFARDLKLRVDPFLERRDIKRKYKLYDQLYSAARSGPSNIAEGFGRYGNKEFARFARIAKGPEVEVLNHLIDLHDQQLITAEELLLAERDARKAIGACTGLIRHLENTTAASRAPNRQEDS